MTSITSNKSPPVLYIMGLKQICSIWLSPNLQLSAVYTLPHYFGVRDYQCMILDFPKESFLGNGFILIYKPEMWRLTTKQPKVV